MLPRLEGISDLRDRLGKASTASSVAVKRTGRRPWNSPTARLTLVWLQLPNQAELASVCNSLISRLSTLIAAIVEHCASNFIPAANRWIFVA
jgi:hypothetical protein